MIRRSFFKACAALLPASVLTPLATKAEVIVSVDRGNRGKVYESNGFKVEGCVEANLTTGRCVIFLADRDGKLIHNSQGDLIKVMVERSAPMRFESM